MELFLTIFLSAAVGIVVGMLSGMLGVGGGTILVPIFKLLYGMPAINATATSLFTIIPTSLTGVVAHVRGRTCIPLLGLAAGIGGACTSPLGVWLASISPEWAIMIAAALVIGYSSITMFRKAFKLKHTQAPKTSTDNLEFHASAARQVLVGSGVGLFAGVVSGYVGVGGGFIMVPMFMQLLKTPMKLTSGTSLIAVMILATTGTITQALMGNVEWLAGIFISIGAIPGAAIGSKLMRRISELKLRFGFASFLLVAAALLILNQLGIF